MNLPARKKRITTQLKVKNIKPLFLLVLFLFAFTVRLIFLLESRDNPFLHTPVVDMSTAWQNSEKILQGRVSYEKVFWKPPLYVYFIAFIRLFTGRSVLGFLVVQNIIGAFNCVLLYILSWKVFQKRVALIAALIMCVYGPFLFFDSCILSVTLSTLINLCLLLSLTLVKATTDFHKYIIPGI